MKSIYEVASNNIVKSSFTDVKKINYYLSLTLALFSIFFLSLSEFSFRNRIAFALDGSIYFFLSSMYHYQVLKWGMTHFHGQSKKFNLWRYVLGILGTIAIHFIIFPVSFWLSDFGDKTFNWVSVLVFTGEGVLLSVLIIILHDFIILRFYKKQMEIENSVLRMRSEEAKNLLLKRQIHPHFFFNSLYTLKAIYKKDLNVGETYLLHLAAFMRSAISNHHSQAATLQEEMSFCDNYLAMQKIRFGDALQEYISIEEKEKYHWFIPFFTLQPLVENAIKHNVLTKEHPMTIGIVQKGNLLRVENTLQVKSLVESSTKSGLENLAERYRMWCGEELVIRQTKELFIVEFKLFSDENPNH